MSKSNRKCGTRYWEPPMPAKKRGKSKTVRGTQSLILEECCAEQKFAMIMPIDYGERRPRFLETPRQKSLGRVAFHLRPSAKIEIADTDELSMSIRIWMIKLPLGSYAPLATPSRVQMEDLVHDLPLPVNFE